MAQHLRAEEDRRLHGIVLAPTNNVPIRLGEGSMVVLIQQGYRRHNEVWLLDRTRPKIAGLSVRPQTNAERKQ